MPRKKTEEVSLDDLNTRRRELVKELEQVNNQIGNRTRTENRAVPRIGGTFAPPCTSDDLKNYREVVKRAAPAVEEAVNKLADMVEEFVKTPASKKKGTPHPSGVGSVVKLEQEEIDRMDEHVPWDHEIKSYETLFDTIQADDKELRKAAFHLLWYAKELSMDREPLTNDRL